MKHDYVYTGRFEKTDLFIFVSVFKKNSELYNNLGIVVPVQKCVSKNGKTIPKVLDSLFWALNFLKNGYKNDKGPLFLKRPVYLVVSIT